MAKEPIPRRQVPSSKPHAREITQRLRRIQGQISGILRMYEEDRYCIEVLDQISSARAGLQSTALLILDDHVTGCVADAIETGETNDKMSELLHTVERFVRSV